jgi:amino acid transporter
VPAVGKRVLSGVLAAASIAYIVFLFLPWADPGDDGFSSEPAGVDTIPGFLSLAGAVVLALWELLGIAGVRRSLRSDSLVSFLLAASTAAVGILGVVHLKRGSPYPFPIDLAYGAFVAFALALVLLGGAILHLLLHIIETRRH